VLHCIGGTRIFEVASGPVMVHIDVTTKVNDILPHSVTVLSCNFSMVATSRSNYLSCIHYVPIPGTDSSPQVASGA